MDDSLFYVQSIGGEVEIENMEPENGNNENSAMSVEEDIYGDLDTLVFSSASKNKAVPREVLESRLSAAVKEIGELKDRITKLSTENLNLINNFSSLLKTAREDKEKNIFTLRELRNQLRHVTNVNIQRSSLSKEEVDKIHAYCNEVESQLQSQISLQVIRQALDAAKREQQETKKSAYKRKWSKQFKFDNMSIYLCKEQIPFGRLERVTFPAKNPPENTEVSIRKQSSTSAIPPESAKLAGEIPKSNNGTALGEITSLAKTPRQVPEAPAKGKLPDDVTHKLGQPLDKPNSKRRNSKEEPEKPYDRGYQQRKLTLASGRQRSSRDRSIPHSSERPAGSHRRNSRSSSKEPPYPSRRRAKQIRTTRPRSPSPNRRTRRSHEHRRRH